jgi:hypothetical protein
MILNYKISKSRTAEICKNTELPVKALFMNKEFLFITHTVEHNYISPSSTIGIQLHVSALYVGHLQVVI